MNAAKHTPGPWEFFTDGEPIRGLQKKYIKSSSCGQGFAHTVGLHEPTDTANARLIAAAPELLDSLQELHDEFKLGGACLRGECQHPQCIRTYEVFDRAGEIIRKARGEQ